MPSDLTPIRIGICGSASVGKTTLANALARDLHLPCLQEEMRAFLERTRLDLTSLPAPEREAILLQMWADRRHRESSTPSFIADNSPLDFAAYALYYGHLSDCGLDTLLAEARTFLAHYTTVLILPWGALPYQQDGIRASSPHLQMRYQVLIEGLLLRHLPHERLHFLPTHLLRLEDRLRWAKSHLPAQPATPNPALLHPEPRQHNRSAQ